MIQTSRLAKAVAFLLAVLASVAPAQTQTGVLGTNLNALSDFSRHWTFVDAFKLSRPWLDGSFAEFPAGQIDSDGWVTNLTGGQVAQALMFFDQSGHYPSTPNCAASPSATNCYVLKFDGAGAITFDAGANIVSTPGPGNRFFVNVPQQGPGNGGIVLKLTATTPGNPVKNIRFIMAGFESTADAQPFHPTFLQTLAPYKLIRFMDWMGTNGSTIQNFSQWKTLASATQTVVDGPGFGEHGSGVAFEYMVDLCNALDADMWINLPAEASDAFMTSAATLIRDRLEPGRKLYIEYSNEIWNGQFLQGIFIQQQGETLGLGSGFTAKLNYQARRSKEMFAIFETVFGGTSRIVRVLAGQAANADLVKQVAEFESVFLKADAIALAPYMDGGGRVGGLANLTSLSNSQVLSQMQTHLVGTTDNDNHVKLWLETHRNLVHGPGLFGSFTDGMVNDQGVPLRIVAYEGGQHLLALGPNNGNATANGILDSVNRDAGMGTLYKQYLCQWRAIVGGDSFVHFNDLFVYGAFGRWGALEFQDQATSTSPKFLALEDYAQGGLDCAGLGFPNPPLISINDVSVAEGNAGTTNLTFTVSLSTPAPGTITVKAKAVAGTASSPSDFAALTEPVSFALGETSKTVTVVINGDTSGEPSETVFVNLSNPVGAPIADAHGVGTIVDDDVSPVLAIADAATSEGNAGTKLLSFTVTLTPASASTVTVSAQTSNGTATAPSDYSALGPTLLTFTPGQVSKVVDVTILGDVSPEASETFTVTLSGATNANIADATAVGVIQDDDGPARTFVSATGSDANACSAQTTPCRNIATALLQTAVDGEIIILTPGEYETAALTITQGVKVTSPSGTVAFIRQPITVNAPGARVILRGLTIKGTGSGSGVTLTAASQLSIEDSTIDRWNVGFRVNNATAGRVSVVDSIVRANVTGIKDEGTGATNHIAVTDTRIERNTDGLSVLGGSYSIRGVAFVGNSGSGLLASGGLVVVSGSEFSLNGNGAATTTGGTLRVGRSHVFGNTVGLSALSGGTLASFGTNVVRRNGTNTNGTISAVSEQ